MTDAVVYVFDSGPLSALTRAGHLDVVRTLLGGAKAVMPDVVASELREGAATHPHLQAFSTPTWPEVAELVGDQALAAFAYYAGRLVGPGGKNLGECGVLALAETTPGAVAVVDDRAAHNAGKVRGVKMRRTLGLLCEAIRAGNTTVAAVSGIADDLIATSYRLPFPPGGFAFWATEQGLG